MDAKTTDPELLLGYYEAVLNRSKEYLARLTEKAPDRVLNEPPYRIRLVCVVVDNLWHAVSGNA